MTPLGFIGLGKLGKQQRSQQKLQRALHVGATELQLCFHLRKMVQKEKGMAADTHGGVHQLVRSWCTQQLACSPQPSEMVSQEAFGRGLLGLKQR